MKLLLSSLLLACLCTLSSWSVSSSDALVVTQEANVSAMEGDTVNITCCWTGEVERMTVKWMKNHSVIESILKTYPQRPPGEKTSNCSVLTLTDVTKEDSGRYTCKMTVEIPTFSVTEGTGSVITVTDRKNISGSTDRPDPPTGADNDSQLPVIISVAVVAPLMLITLVCVCVLRWTQAQAARVIYEVPHIDSELADMDKHSTSSSRGSSQWCQVPVYESFDYFERVQTKESG